MLGLAGEPLGLAKVLENVEKSKKKKLKIVVRRCSFGLTEDIVVGGQKMLCSIDRRCSSWLSEHLVVSRRALVFHF